MRIRQNLDHFWYAKDWPEQRVEAASHALVWLSGANSKSDMIGREARLGLAPKALEFKGLPGGGKSEQQPRSEHF